MLIDAMGIAYLRVGLQIDVNLLWRLVSLKKGDLPLMKHLKFYAKVKLSINSLVRYYLGLFRDSLVPNLATTFWYYTGRR